MNYLELQFPVLGPSLPVQHGYPLYGALSRLVPSLHDQDSPVRIAPVRGMLAGQGVIQLPERRSMLRIRLPEELLRTFLPLAGRSLDVAGHRVRLGVPRVQALIPAASLASRLVLVKANQRKEEKQPPLLPPTPEQFLSIVQKKLQDMGIQGKAALPLATTGPHAGHPRRGILRLHDRSIVGYAVLVEGLSVEESIRLQERGIGQKLRMGCGFFTSFRRG